MLKLFNNLAVIFHHLIREFFDVTVRGSLQSKLGEFDLAFVLYQQAGCELSVEIALSIVAVATIGGATGVCGPFPFTWCRRSVSRRSVACRPLLSVLETGFAPGESV